MPDSQEKLHRAFCMKDTYETGLAGERFAAEWLRQKYGMQLIESRCRNKGGEIDLIMADGDTIAFIEIKTRLNAPRGSGLMSVDFRKQKRIARAAVLWLMEHDFMNRSVRFDAAEVSSSGILYIRNAFQPGNMFYR